MTDNERVDCIDRALKEVGLEGKWIHLIGSRYAVTKEVVFGRMKLRFCYDELDEAYVRIVDSIRANDFDFINDRPSDTMKVVEKILFRMKRYPKEILRDEDNTLPVDFKDLDMGKNENKKERIKND